MADRNLAVPGGSWGLGFFAGRCAETLASDLSGLQRYACAVKPASCASNSLRGGRSMMLRVPWNSRPMNCTSWSVERLTPGCGPSGLALGVIPLPLATSRCLPSGVTRTDVGYQPTGMKPSERLLPGFSTSNTATVLLSAFATKSVFSSGDSARLFGVDPGGAFG